MAVVLVLLGACSQADPPADKPLEDVGTADAGAQRAEVEVVIGEWFIVSASEGAPSGDVKLVIRNYGRYVHEIEVIRKVAEYQEYEAAEVEDIAPGETATIDLQLSKGTYELACTIVERQADGRVDDHYRLGMSTFISVTDP